MMLRLFLLMLVAVGALSANSVGDEETSRASLLDRAKRDAERLGELPIRVAALARLAAKYREVDPERSRSLLDTIETSFAKAQNSDAADALLLAFIDGSSKAEDIDEFDLLLSRFSDESARDKALVIFARNISGRGKHRAAFENAQKIRSPNLLFSTMSKIAVQSAEGGDYETAAAASRQINPTGRNDFSRKLMTVSELARIYHGAGDSSRARITIGQVLAFAEVVPIAPQASIAVKLSDGGINEDRFDVRLAEVESIIENSRPESVRIDCLVLAVHKLLGWGRIEESRNMLRFAKTPQQREYLAGLIAEQQARNKDAESARETLKTISNDVIKAPAMLQLAKVAMADSRESEARLLLAEIQASVDLVQTSDNPNGWRHLVDDWRRFVQDTVMLQVSMGDVDKAILWVEGMEDSEIMFDCLLSIADTLPYD